MATEDNGSKFVWFLAGAVVGATVALLYAPQSGRKTRKVIREKAEEGREALSDAGKDILDKGRQYYDKGRRIAEDAGDLFERGRKLVSR